MTRGEKKQENEAANDIRAFIFDMDGTLVNSTHIDYEAWVKVFSDHDKNFISYDEYKKLLGVKSSEVLKEYMGLEGDEMEKALKKRLHYIIELFDEKGLSAVPYAEELLKQLRKASYKLALATGARKEKLDAVLSKIDLSIYFDVIVTADDVDKGKPDPALFLEAARQLGISPSQAVVVEDAENGIKAAMKAGMRCIALTTTTPRERLAGADLIIDSYRELDMNSIGAQLRSHSGSQS